jgi:hypothetical protein
MLVRDKKHFTVGLAMAVGFFVLFFIIMSPVFGGGKNGLEYADDMFNKLSKGSAYYVPKVAKSVEKFNGTPLSVTIKLDKPEDVQRVAQMFTVAGATVTPQADSLKIDADLGKFLSLVVRDADLMYKNEGDKVKAAYGFDEKQVLKDWWTSLGKVDKALQNAKEFDKGKIVSDVYTKRVETSYNYYKVEPQKVISRIPEMTALLVFYVVYTLWWGFALYHLFEGLGLTTKKVKVKKEI